MARSRPVQILDDIDHQVNAGAGRSRGAITFGPQPSFVSTISRSTGRSRISQLITDIQRSGDIRVRDIRPQSIRTVHIKDANITTAKIALLAVNTALIADLSVSEGKIIDLAVKEAKIGNLAVVTAKIDNLAVTDAKINDIDAGKITAGLITVDRLNITGIITNGIAWTDNSPGGGEIAWSTGTVTYKGETVTIAAGDTASKYVYWENGNSFFSVSATIPTLTDDDFLIAINSSGLHDLYFNSPSPPVKGIDTSFLDDLAITEDKLDDLSVTGAKIDGRAVDSGHIAIGSIDLEHMSDNSVDSDQYVDGSIDLIHMSANSVDSDQYVDGSIDLIHMSANSVDSDQYVNGSIDRIHLAADIVDGTKIDNDVIESEHYAPSSIDLEHLSTEVTDRMSPKSIQKFSKVLSVNLGTDEGPYGISGNQAITEVVAANSKVELNGIRWNSSVFLEGRQSASMQGAVRLSSNTNVVCNVSCIRTGVNTTDPIAVTVEFTVIEYY